MVGEEGEGTGKQASALAAIYVDFTSGLREITLVGLPLARSHDEGWCGLVVGMKRGVGGGVGGELELCVQEFLVIIFQPAAN